MKISKRTFTKLFLILTATGLILIAGFMIFVDPYLHYHGTGGVFTYSLHNEFYQNAGILKNYEYEALIAGDSETQNFKASEVKEFFGYETVKLPNPGANYGETDRVIRCAIKNNDELKLVIRPMDMIMLPKEWDSERYVSTDWFLYDSNPFNDVKYVYDKESIIDALKTVAYTRAGKEDTSMDDYSKFDFGNVFGDRTNLVNFYNTSKDFGFSGNPLELTALVKDNVHNNIVLTAKENPDIDFYVFIPPYNIIYWKELKDNNCIDNELICEKTALEECLSCGNIHVFSFMNMKEIVTDWQYYSDEQHFCPDINSLILKKMSEKEYEITKDNLSDYLHDMEEFVKNYDYSTILDE